MHQKTATDAPYWMKLRLSSSCTYISKLLKEKLEFLCWTLCTKSTVFVPCKNTLERWAGANMNQTEFFFFFFFFLCFFIPKSTLWHFPGKFFPCWAVAQWYLLVDALLLWHMARVMLSNECLSECIFLSEPHWFWDSSNWAWPDTSPTQLM